MNNKLILFSLIFLISNINGMKRTHNNDISYNVLPNDVLKVIINFCINYTAKKPKEATFMARALARTNKQYNGIINHPQFSDKLIENIAYKFDCSDETIARFLSTEQSKKRLTIQLNRRAHV